MGIKQQVIYLNILAITAFLMEIPFAGTVIALTNIYFINQIGGNKNEN